MGFERSPEHDESSEFVKRSDAWRCTGCRTIYRTAPGSKAPERCDLDACKPRPLRFMISAEGRSTAVLLDDLGDGRQLFSINGRVLEDARAVSIDKAGDRIRVSFQLETGPKP